MKILAYNVPVLYNKSLRLAPVLALQGIICKMEHVLVVRDFLMLFFLIAQRKIALRFVEKAFDILVK